MFHITWNIIMVYNLQISKFRRTDLLETKELSLCQVHIHCNSGDKMAFPHYSSHWTQDDQRDQQSKRKAHKNLVNSEASGWEVNYILKVSNYFYIYNLYCLIGEVFGRCSYANKNVLSKCETRYTNRKMW